MFKKIRLAVLLAIITTTAFAQQPYTAKNLIGRWTASDNDYTGDLIFFTENTGAIVSATGLLNANINYSVEAGKKDMELKYTIDIGRKSPLYHHIEIKFLNDSSFAYKIEDFIPKNSVSSTKRTRVYKKVQSERPGTEPRLPRYADIIGQWRPYFKKETLTTMNLVFVDKEHALFADDKAERKLDYKINFSVQPIPVDFYSGGVQVLQAFLMFEGDNFIRVEFFNNNRGDHFQEFGRSMVLKKVNP